MKRNVIIIILVILVVIGAGALGIYVGKKNNNKTSIAEGIVIPKDNDKDYSIKFITNKKDFDELSNKFNVQDKLDVNDFEKYDYIIDFIPYDNNLLIKDIDLVISGNNVNLTYYTNKEVKNYDKYLVYVIPINKGTIKVFNFENRNFVYDK